MLPPPPSSHSPSSALVMPELSANGFASTESDTRISPMRCSTSAGRHFDWDDLPWDAQAQLLTLQFLSPFLWFLEDGSGVPLSATSFQQNHSVMFLAKKKIEAFRIEVVSKKSFFATASRTLLRALAPDLQKSPVRLMFCNICQNKKLGTVWFLIGL